MEINKRKIKLKYACKCSGCNCELERGCDVMWFYEPMYKAIVCMKCADDQEYVPPRKKDAGLKRAYVQDTGEYFNFLRRVDSKRFNR